MTECLFLISEDATSRVHVIPPNNGRIPRISYDVLSENPYVFTEEEFYHEVHVVRRQREDLNLATYNIRKSELLQQFGWGIHRNSEGKLALIPAESAKYKELSQKLHTQRAYRIRAA
ncbi:hypothetical protein P5868_004794 [Vibrio parahaemolyticus]|nr:hypothetical protein [Vibrio parahaemolyticus]CAH1531384.1 conserved hypothetical protein [Vibrio harveyi]HAS6495943.1 hypothetical protein [Vibrio parahaemolyticus]HAS6511358.1 hypothetical protein [Vibrio parahaemolyticus]HAS6516165.1 hypothetical protein [Vibrio parahaemolyticus]